MKSLGERDIWNDDEVVRDAAVRGFLADELFTWGSDTWQAVFAKWAQTVGSSGNDIDLDTLEGSLPLQGANSWWTPSDLRITKSSKGGIEGNSIHPCPTSTNVAASILGERGRTTFRTQVNETTQTGDGRRVLMQDSG